MRILLIGYGKMGKAIEAIALTRDHEIVGKVDTRDQLLAFKEKADIAIEFTQPESVVGNLSYCFDNNIPVVCGTTGWLAHRSDVEGLCQQKNGGFFYASNFSLGVNLFFKVNEFLARLMGKQEGYEVSIDETHHTQKKDAPAERPLRLPRESYATYRSRKSGHLTQPLC
jgi:Dihydrodipicolinate reductase